MIRLFFVFFLLQCLAAGSILAEEKPNILIIMADDCTYNDLPIYGGQNAKTPHLDALARQGLVFHQAYLGSAMCQPCRAELYTGQYPLSNGCAWNHSASRPEVRSLPHFLRPLGYRVGIAGKVHVKPKGAFPFDPVPGFDANCVREPTLPHELEGIEDYMDTRKHNSPFCLVVALVEPHIPWTMGDASQYPPEELKLPPNLADTPVTRQHFSDYLAEITYMDGQVGEILAALKRSGAQQNTIVLFTSEQGSQFPGCKWTNWNTGLHTGLIARWPDRIEAGRRTDALVQYADITPTLVQLAGGEPFDEFDGTSFQAVLLGQKDRHRSFAYGMHNNLPEGPRYPIRSVTDGKHRYIRNLLPSEIYIEKHLMGGGRLNNPYWATWVGADPLRQENTYRLVKRYMSRPAEQLYLTESDPYELNNRIGETGAMAESKDRLRRALDNWMTEQQDPGADVDTAAALKAARKGEHLHGRFE
ncbi:MAG: sulfatase [Mariniblastus sp.]|nr:sulfatase [Mariniblastus sp.]